MGIILIGVCYSDHFVVSESPDGTIVNMRFPRHSIVLFNKEKREDKDFDKILSKYTFISRPNHFEDRTTIIDYTKFFVSFFETLNSLYLYEYPGEHTHLSWGPRKKNKLFKFFIPKIGICRFCKFNVFLTEDKMCMGCIDEIKQLNVNPGYIYVITDGTYYKIGKSKKFPTERLKAISKCQSRDFKLLAYCFCDTYDEIEKKLHKDFYKFNVKGEWFKFDLEFFYANCGFEFTRLV